MKIGRNAPCPCGSGKKYKKCCLDKEEEKPSYEKNYFELKGKNSEKFVYSLAKKSFLVDWCYLNPEIEKGKELCDLLVVFGENAIIWQIKDLKKGGDGRYSKQKVEKNLKQLSGAKRSLFDLKKKIELVNPHRGKELFDPEKIKNIYLISALVGEGEDYFEFIKKIKDKTVHVLNKEGVEILLNELDTIDDFINYLKEKEKLVSQDIQLTISGGEEELLAYYLMNGRSFESFEGNSLVMLQEGFWEEFQKKPEYLAKKEEDKISYFWDFLIDKAHLSKEKNYELVAREMARLNRFQRRMNSKMFFEGQAKASIQKDKDLYKRIISENGISYCFLYSDVPRETRKNLLGNVCFSTRDYFKQNKRVLGISTEKTLAPYHSFEFCLLDFPTWTPEDEKQAKEINESLNIFKNQETSRFVEDEYPKGKSPR